MFAQKKVTLPPGRHKIVILDEADRSVAPVGAFRLFRSTLVFWGGGHSLSHVLMTKLARQRIAIANICPLRASLKIEESAYRNVLICRWLAA